MQANKNTSHSEDGYEAAESIYRALADEFALSAVTRDYHWQVTGPQFRSLGELFGDQYRQLDLWIEKLGGRVRALGAIRQASWSELIQRPRYVPARGAGLDPADMMSELIGLHDRMIDRLRTDAALCASVGRDAVTAGLLRALAEFHETTAWMLGELVEDRVLVPV